MLDITSFALSHLLSDKAKPETAPTIGGSGKPADVKVEADELLKKGAEKQKDTLTALGRMKEKVSETEQVRAFLFLLSFIFEKKLSSVCLNSRP